MSRVIIEAQAGDSLYVLENFHASPKGQEFSWDTAKEFLVGQRVKYKSFRWNDARDEHDRGNLQPTWLVTFDCDGIQYEATQDYFSTQDAWDGLMKVFGAERVKNDGAVADKVYAGKSVWGWLSILIPLLIVTGIIWVCSGMMRVLTYHP